MGARVLIGSDATQGSSASVELGSRDEQVMMRQIATTDPSAAQLPLGRALLILIKADPKSLRLEHAGTGGSATANAAAVGRALDSLTATLCAGATAMRAVSSALLEQVRHSAPRLST
jgi:hypothetical protein